MLKKIKNNLEIFTFILILKDTGFLHYSKLLMVRNPGILNVSVYFQKVISIKTIIETKNKLIFKSSNGCGGIGIRARFRS